MVINRKEQRQLLEKDMPKVVDVYRFPGRPSLQQGNRRQMQRWLQRVRRYHNS